MKKILLSSLCLMAAVQSHAYSERDASALVKKYSAMVACQLEDMEQDKNQYKAVKMASDDKEIGTGAVYVVFWYGDLGCSGGNATITPNFTVVEHAGFSSAAPIVSSNYEFPDLDIVSVTSFAGKNGVLEIQGLTYGPKDQQHQPRKKVSYRLQFVDEKFIRN